MPVLRLELERELLGRDAELGRLELGLGLLQELGLGEVV